MDISSIERLRLRNKPFPLRALLTLYLHSAKKDTYCNYFEGFRLLAKWLGPIGLPPNKSTTRYNPLISYEVNRIAVILGVHPSLIFHTILEISNGSPNPTTVLFDTTHTPHMPAQVPVVQDECQ